MKAFLIYTTVLFLANTNVQALKCYICATSENALDQRCITTPEEKNTLNCNKKYCTTTRVEYLEPNGRVTSLNRNCVDKPVFLNGVIEDSRYRTYYTACQTDLCNGGSGNDTSQGGLFGDVEML